MLSNFLRKNKLGCYKFTKIYFGESLVTGRCTYGTTRKDVLDYFTSDDVIDIKRAWMCQCRKNDKIVSFAMTRNEAHEKIERVLKYVHNQVEEGLPETQPTFSRE